MSGPTQATQPQATELINQQRLEEVCRLDPIMAHHLEDTKTAGNSKWISDPKGSVNCMGTCQARGQLRIRLNTPHARIPRNDDGTITCPGCRKRVPPSLWSSHARGCVKVRGAGAQTAHAIIKKQLKAYLSILGVHCDEREPNVSIVTCPRCRTTVDASNPDTFVADHRGECERITGLPYEPRDLMQARQRRPDVRVYCVNDTIVIDLTIAGTTTSTFIKKQREALNNLLGLEVKVKPVKSSEEKLRRAESTKDKSYKAKVEKSGQERFLPVAATPVGTLGRGAQDFIRAVAATCPGLVSIDRFVLDFKKMVAAASGSALMAAERAAGVTHINRAMNAPEDLWLAEGNGSHLDTIDCPPESAESHAYCQAEFEESEGDEQSGANCRPQNMPCGNQRQTASAPASSHNSTFLRDEPLPRMSR
jgi:hypothetical protein